MILHSGTADESFFKRKNDCRLIVTHKKISIFYFNANFCTLVLCGIVINAM